MVVPHQSDLDIFEKIGNLILPLVADHLRNPLFGLVHGAFELDHPERDPVDEEHQIGTPGLGPLLPVDPVDDKLLRHMEEIVFRVLIVDVAQ